MITEKFHQFYKKTFPFLALIVSVTLFPACKKNIDNNDNEVKPQSGVMAINLAPGQNSVGFTIGSSQLNSVPLAFANYTGTYLSVTAGAARIASWDVVSGTLIDSIQTSFSADKFYSIFLMGTTGNYKNLVVNDPAETLTPAAGTAFVRYVNAIPEGNAPNIKVSTGSSTFIDAAASFRAISDFVAVPAGAIEVAINNGGNVKTNRTIDVEQHKLYTVLLLGTPANIGPADAVQIQFIVNGRIAQ